MKSGKSSLNPYAESYVPIAKRENETFKTAEGNKTPWLGNKASLVSNASQASGKPFPHGEFTTKCPQVYSSYGSSSQNRDEFTAKDIPDDEYEMDLVYLQMQFPGVSGQSIADVYLANGGDLEATVDMLNLLEPDDGEPSENLPDTLDIGDVAEPIASLKPKVPPGSSFSGAR